MFCGFIRGKMLTSLRSVRSSLKKLGSFTLVKNTSNMSRHSYEKIVWLDMEMTGLDIDKDRILEVACVITDSQCDITAESATIIVHQPDYILTNMDEWCIKQHGQSGLLDACRTSHVTVEEAEDYLLDFISRHVVKHSSPVAGNSVYMDRLFLRKFMPKVNDYLHYRIIDVSSIKELCRLWNPGLYKTVPKKRMNHRALDDIRESVAELKFYKDYMF